MAHDMAYTGIIATELSVMGQGGAYYNANGFKGKGSSNEFVKL